MFFFLNVNNLTSLASRVNDVAQFVPTSQVDSNERHCTIGISLDVSEESIHTNFDAERVYTFTVTKRIYNR